MFRKKWLPVILLLLSSIYLMVLADSKLATFVLVVDLIWILDWYFRNEKIQSIKFKRNYITLGYQALLVVGLALCLMKLNQLHFQDLDIKSLFAIIPVLFLGTYRKRRRQLNV